jgi:hypothetical protein
MKLPTVQLSPFSRYFIPLRFNIFSSAPCSQNSSVYALLLMLETKFHTHTKQLVEFIWTKYFKTYGSIFRTLKLTFTTLAVQLVLGVSIYMLYWFLQFLALGFPDS